MEKQNQQDWRIDTYDGHLNGRKFELKKFKTKGKNDHEHCIFCWQKITDLIIDGCDKDGYCTVNLKSGQTDWVCKNCFHDFQTRFNFKLN